MPGRDSGFAGNWLGEVASCCVLRGACSRAGELEGEGPVLGCRDAARDPPSFCSGAARERLERQDGSMRSWPKNSRHSWRRMSFLF